MTRPSAKLCVLAWIAAACGEEPERAGPMGSGPAADGGGPMAPGDDAPNDADSGEADDGSDASTSVASTDASDPADPSAGESGDNGDPPAEAGGETTTGPTPTGEVPPGTWLPIAPGTFRMGALPTDPCPMSPNDFAHEVTLTHPFEITATEVTQAEYESVMGALPANTVACADCPVALMTWHTAAEVCNAYSEIAGFESCYACSSEGGAVTCVETLAPHECAGYRLPTEAEWEYAARAGETATAHGGQIEVCGYNDPLLDTLGWYLYNSEGGTHPVATKAANAWGLFDTIGNVWEWTHDGYLTDLSEAPAVDPVVASPDGLRVMRGGSYNCLPGEVRLSHRSGLPDQIAGLNVGVRCARTLD